VLFCGKILLRFKSQLLTAVAVRHHTRAAPEMCSFQADVADSLCSGVEWLPIRLEERNGSLLVPRHTKVAMRLIIMTNVNNFRVSAIAEL
jgi:hypothetical protein